MASDVASKPPSVVASESKSARKRKTKGDAPATTTLAQEVVPTAVVDTDDGKSNGAESENVYIKELQK